jgi:ABC-2 type transport system ATP-binding protein
MTVAIEIHELTKRYGARTAIDNLDLSVEQGDIFGFVGPNGAGKTSAIRIIACLLQATRGMVSVGGYDVKRSPYQVKQLIGYLPDYFGVYPNLQVWEYLDFFAACYHIPEARRPVLIDGLLELVDLKHRRGDQVDRLSRGMKQRLGLARTLIHDPQILVLDEPAAGLDPRARVEIRELLVELAHMGKTVFFSTHILADVAEICTRVGIIEAGQLVAQGSLEELHMQIMPHRQVEITLLGSLQPAQELLQTLPGVANIEVQPGQNNGTWERLAFEFSGDDQALCKVLAVLVQNGFPVLHFSEASRDLEEVFMRATKGLVT